MNKQPDSETDVDRLDQALAKYMEEAEAFKDSLSELCALQAKYVEDHLDLAPQLLSHFENESVVLSDLGSIPCRLPDFGRYTDIKYLGHGGMGVVYKAFDQELDISLALKMSLPGNLITAEEMRRFSLEAQSMAKLKHPNIVRVHDVGEHEGRPFLSMELVEARSLDEHLDRFTHDQRSAAKLMVGVARAVHHAHQRRVLHRDLKPANILLDKDESGGDRPYVTDFGLAKPIGADGLPAEVGGTVSATSQVYQTIAGTASYMSPEQAEGKDVTTLSDVYGLGAILYTLHTGEPPFRGQTVEATLKRVKNPKEKPKPPREINPHVDRTLEAISLRCLRKDPQERYRSAEGLAKDLDRWLTYRPTEARPLWFWERSWLWGRRTPLGAGLAVLILAFLTLVALNMYDRLQEPGRAQTALAQQKAETFHLRLKQLSRAVGAAAGDPKGSELLTQRDLAGLQAFIEGTGNSRVDLNGQSPFESWFMSDLDGKIVARWPAPSPETEGKDLRRRDYYQGALGLAKTEGGAPVYISRVYKAFSDDLYKFGIAAAVRDGEKIVGVLAASVTTSRQMGLPETESDEFTTALVARKDPFFAPGEPAAPADASEYLILLHPAYERRTPPVWVPQKQIETIRQCMVDNSCITDDYYDPVASLNEQYTGRWIYGFAPVEDSEFIVVVQRRYSQVIPTALWVVVGFCLVTLLSAGVVRYVLPRARQYA